MFPNPAGKVRFPGVSKPPSLVRPLKAQAAGCCSSARLECEGPETPHLQLGLAPVGEHREPWAGANPPTHRPTPGSALVRFPSADICGALGPLCSSLSTLKGLGVVWFRQKRKTSSKRLSTYARARGHEVTGAEFIACLSSCGRGGKCGSVWKGKG